MRMLSGGEEPPTINSLSSESLTPWSQRVCHYTPIPDAQIVKDAPRPKRPWRQRLPWLLLLVAVILFGLWSCGAIG